MNQGDDFEIHGDGAVLRGTVSGEGPPVLWLHAGRERGSVWWPVIDEVRRHAELSCTTIDQRGHGESTGSVDRLTPFVRDATALIERIAQPLVVVGCSLGGLAAIGAMQSARIRSMIVGLVLVDILPDPDPVAARAFLRQAGLLPASSPLVDDVLGHGAALRSTLRDFGGALMLVRGERSVIPDEDVARFHCDHPRARLETVADAGHLVARDQPVRLGRLLAPILSDWLTPQS